MPERLRVPPVEDPDLVVEVELQGEPVVRLVGSADNGAAAPLADLIQTVHGELRAKAVREVVVDLSALDSLASTCLKQLVAWVRRLQALPAAERYRIKLRINNSIRWQVNTVPALTCFDTALVTVER